jgi:DNA polymerase IIIc chi subunit
MIGVSLSYQKLLYTEEEALRPTVLLPQLLERGVRSVELRAVPAGEDPASVLRVANLLWDYGFQITVHACCESVQSAVEDVLLPLRALLAQLRQRELIVTLHPVVGDNVALLTVLSDHVQAQGYPVRIALENNRKKMAVAIIYIDNKHNSTAFIRKKMTKLLESILTKDGIICEKSL